MLSKEFLRRVLIRDALVRFSVFTGLGLAFFTAGFMVWRGWGWQDREVVALHYNIYFGIDLVGPWQGIFLPAVIGLAAFLLNLLGILLLYDRKRILAYLLAGGTVFLQALLLVASIFIVLLNI
ncbi:hypothetical protein HY628_00545 [Candidatus Uhrbacteria bacterium]|nr:hypothetical protein [Candidatus Uhrbacteria bacterium]